METQPQKGTKIDTIPPSLKKFFYSDKEMPNFTKDYDAIGFDADHCFVKYNIKEITKLLVKISLEDMKVDGWPDEITHFDYESELPSCLNYSMFDIDQGLVLKLGENKEVLAAMKGRKSLTQEEICQYYGPMAKYDGIEWPNLHSFPELDGPSFWTFSTFFDSVKVPMVLMGVELINSGKVQKDYEELSRDMRKSIYRQYLHTSMDRQTVYPAATYGQFFPQLFANPTKYIIEQPELRDVMSKLKEQGKFIFLGTNSMFDYMELIMSTTLGKDWRSFFNMVFCDCRKPNFFKGEANMFERDASKESKNGARIGSYLDLKEDSDNVTYLEGNTGLLDEYLKKKYNKQRPQVAFFGDQYTSDAHWGNANEGWNGIAIIEEIMLQPDFKEIEDASPFAPVNHGLINYDKYWGQNYFIHSEQNPKKNWYVEQVSKNSRYAVPMVRHITNFMDY